MIIYLDVEIHLLNIYMVLLFFVVFFSKNKLNYLIFLLMLKMSLINIHVILLFFFTNNFDYP